jgi:hypothetical protein
VYCEPSPKLLPPGKLYLHITCSVPDKYTAMWFADVSLSPAPEFERSNSTTRALDRLHPAIPLLAEPGPNGAAANARFAAPAMMYSHASPLFGAPVFWIENFAENPPGPWNAVAAVKKRPPKLPLLGLVSLVENA